jgi:hypothetical protein
VRKIALLLLTAAGLSACGGPPNHPLPMVASDAPVVPLNPDRWQATVNDLTQPPGDGTPHPLPSPANLPFEGPSL